MKVTTVLKALSLIFTLLLVVVVAPIAFILLTDPNDFKAHIQQQALDQGVQLDIAGDLNWSIYPDIELEVRQVALRSDQLAESNVALDANLGLARLQVELRPLFSGELKIRGIEVSEGLLSLKELVPSTDEPENESAKQGASNLSDEQPPMVSIELIKLEKLRFKYISIDNIVTELKINELSIEQLNLSGEQFPINLSLSYKDEEQEIAFYTEATVSIDLEKQNYKLSTEQLAVDLDTMDMAQPLTVTAGLEAALNKTSNQWSLTLAEAKVDDLTAKANASGSIEPMSALGQLKLSGGSQLFNQLAGQSLINTLNVRMGFDYSSERLRLNEFAANINKSTITSSIEHDLTGDKRSSVNISIDQINLDDYLADESNNQAGEPSSEAENPLMFLEGISATDVALSIDSLVSSGQTITDINIEATIKNAEADIRLVNATLAEGVLKGKVIARATEQPQIMIPNFAASQINLAPLTLNESGKPLLQGVANLDFKGQVLSLSGDSVVKELDGSGQMDITDLLLADINIEQSICESAQRLGASAALAEQWSPGTQFERMTSPYKISKGVLTLNQIGTGFGNLKLGGTGKLDLDSMNFGADFSLRINGERTSEQGCSINKYLRDTALPLSCEGNLSEDGETSCGINSSVVGDLLKGQLKGELGRQLSRLLGGDKEVEAGTDEEGNKAPNEATEQDSSDQVKDAVKGILEGLFKQ